jgi:hypothetical protein
MDAQSLFGPISTRSYQIGDFDTFVLNSVPYGQVLLKDIQWGAIEYDGPDAPGISGAKPVLQWHFGGVPYPITRAIRMYYTYTRTWDGSNDTITTSLLIGLQRNLNTFIRPNPIPFVATPSLTYQTRVNNVGAFSGFSNPVWGSDSAVLASEANGVVRTAFQQPISPEITNLAFSQEIVRRLQQGAPDPTLSAFIQTELALDNVGFAILMERTVAIDFDGPAHDSDSLRPFRYTVATLANSPDPYSRVLFWYFAGKPWRLTKAMRIPLDAPDVQPAPAAAPPSLVVQAALGPGIAAGQPQGDALFIGFAGPGSDPSA